MTERLNNNINAVSHSHRAWRVQTEAPESQVSGEERPWYLLSFILLAEVTH